MIMNSFIRRLEQTSPFSENIKTLAFSAFIIRFEIVKKRGDKSSFSEKWPF